jgi:crossover junction endodeoxyribonuclease RuvC
MDSPEEEKSRMEKKARSAFLRRKAKGAAMRIMGIDPGLTGAVAIIGGGEVVLRDTPIMLVKNGKKMKMEYLPAEMAAILHDNRSLEEHVFLEKVSAMPGQGVTSMFGFGKGYGIWIGILAALRIPYTLVTPQAWKKEIMQGMKDKDAARLRALELYPEVVSKLTRKKDIGRADALLIAEYGRRITR